jgi:hypothetical protein
MTDDRTDTTAEHNDDREPAPGKPQEKVEDRPNVSTVTPEDYPKKSRASGDKA